MFAYVQLPVPRYRYCRLAYHRRVDVSPVRMAACQQLISSFADLPPFVSRKWWRLSSNGVAEKRALAADLRSDRVSNPSATQKHGPSLMFAWPSASYFRGAIVDASTIIDVCDLISSPCWRDTAIGQKVRDTQSSCMIERISRIIFFILSTPISPRVRLHARKHTL